MNVNTVWDEMTGIYPLSKTIRFELKPVGRTLEYINSKRLLEEDEQRAKDFLKVKEIMNDYSRERIKENLTNVKLDKNLLELFKEAFIKLKGNKSESKLKKEYKELANKLSKELHKNAKLTELEEINEKNFIKPLKEWLEKNNHDEDLKLVISFDGFSTYFRGFFENRKNIFKGPEKDNEDAISTSIVYRTINENLVLFLDDLLKFEELSKLGIDFSEVEENFNEELDGKKLVEFITLENYNSFLTQEGIDKFNLIIGGKTTENGIKLKGMNEIINLYSQKKDDKKIRKKRLKQLYKQILSKLDKSNFIPKKLEDDREFISLINCADKRENFEGIKELFNNLQNYDLNEIHIKNDESLTKLSQDLFSNWEFLKKLMIESKFSKKTERQKEIEFKKQDYFSIKEIEDVINNKKGLFDLDEDKENFKNKISNNSEHPIVGYFQRFYFNGEDLLKNIEDSYKEVEEILEESYSDGTKEFLQQNKEKEVEKIKLFLDNSLNIFHFIKLLNYKKGKADDYAKLDVDSDFYEGCKVDEKEIKGFFEFYNSIKEIVNIYDKARNYVTQKPFSKNKFKLNFNNSTLAAGWDKNKEVDNWTVLFRKDGKYFLGIMDKDSNRLFKEISRKGNDNFYKKIEYKLLPSPSKMLPKVFFSDKWKQEHKIPEEILKIYKNKTFIKGDNFRLEDCHKLIGFYKESIKQHPEWNSYFKFEFKDLNEYLDIGEFYRDVQNQGYSISFVNIDSEVINNYVDEGKLYLFQIYNKDFSEYSKGKKNLHTLYWNALFSEENLKDVVFKLNGEAELFFREGSIKKEDKVVHKKNEFIKNKDPINNKNQSKFNYDLTKDKRYTEDKFFFYCPITINFKANGNEKTLNKKVSETIKKNFDGIKVLGIDRGERNLAYFSLINQNGEIEKQDSFNIVLDKFNRKNNYLEKLDKKEGQRNEARKNWTKIENIKELKEGYLSQVVHQVVKMAIENNAIIVFEDLNFVFKRGRFKIEKQIYQKFEKMLIEKLNYLMFKDIENNKSGGLMKAYQLTPKFDSFKKLGKQTGILFYVNANYTSKIDPKTGFVNLLYPNYENEKQAKEFFKKFDSIKYNKEKDYFEFKFDYKNFKVEEKNLPKKSKWVVCSYGERLHQEKDPKSKAWNTVKINLTERLKELFNNSKLDYYEGEDIKEEILKQNNAKFFKELVFLLNKILQIRNSYTSGELRKKIEKRELNFESEGDYILSCVHDKNGEFFDSRAAKEGEPKDADANGALNIARKGLIILERIKESIEKPDLKIENKEFFDFVQSPK